MLRCRPSVGFGVLGRGMGSLRAPRRWPRLSWITCRMLRTHSCFSSNEDACGERGQHLKILSNNGLISKMPSDGSWSGRTFRTVLLSDVGVRPTHRANLQGSPSMCSVTPSSEVWETAAGKITCSYYIYTLWCVSLTLLWGHFPSLRTSLCGRFCSPVGQGSVSP